MSSLLPPTAKTCGACGQTKEMATNFNVVPSNPSFRKNICIACEELNQMKMKPQVVATLDIKRIYA
jgi:hypothetical protein